jgi:tetratricopeptide (TPR) repeat protein
MTSTTQMLVEYQAGIMTDIQPESESERQQKPQNGQKPQSEEGKRRKHIDVIALATAIGALVAAGYAGWSVHVASQANIASEQQQLLTLSTNIAEQFANQQTTFNQAVAGLTGSARAAALATADAGFAAQISAEGETAQVLITKLRGDGVAGIEYIQVGKALSDAGDIADALAYFQAAVTAPPHAAVTITSAWRNAGNLEYILGHAAAGHKDVMSAVEVFNGYNPYISKFDRANDVAQSYYYDAKQQLTTINGCAVAKTDMTAGNHVLAAAGGIDRAKSVVTSLYNDDQSLYEIHCPKSRK